MEGINTSNQAYGLIVSWQENIPSSVSEQFSNHKEETDNSIYHSVMSEHMPRAEKNKSQIITEEKV